MTVFEQVKSALDMQTVAEGYGLRVNRSGMLLCPFHEEKTASAKIYPDGFHCFGCGEHHDVISFTQKLFQLSKPMDAVRKLNADFGLHLDVDTPPDKDQITEYQKRVNERREYEAWEKSAWNTLHDYVWLLREWRTLAPASPDDELDERFVYALHHLDYADWMCDEFIIADKNGRLTMRDSISAIADFLSRQAHETLGERLYI